MNFFTFLCVKVLFAVLLKSSLILIKTVNEIDEIFIFIKLGFYNLDVFLIFLNLFMIFLNLFLNLERPQAYYSSIVLSIYLFY